MHLHCDVYAVRRCLVAHFLEHVRQCVVNPHVCVLACVLRLWPTADRTGNRSGRMPRIPGRCAECSVDNLCANVDGVFDSAHDLVAICGSVTRLCQCAASANGSDLQSVRVKCGCHLTPTRRIWHLVQHFKAALYGIEARSLCFGEEIWRVVLRFQIPSVYRLGIQCEATVSIAVSHGWRLRRRGRGR